MYISSDHGGFNYRQSLVQYLLEQGFDIIDIGPNKLDPADDYPQFAKELALMVTKEVSTDSKLARNDADDSNATGIIICRNGVGVSIVANKFPGIRCALCFNIKQAGSARNDDNANVLSLPADYVTLEEAKEISKSFLETPFGSHERYKRRLGQITQIEKEFING